MFRKNKKDKTNSVIAKCGILYWWSAVFFIGKPKCHVKNPSKSCHLSCVAPGAILCVPTSTQASWVPNRAGKTLGHWWQWLGGSQWPIAKYQKQALTCSLLHVRALRESSAIGITCSNYTLQHPGLRDINISQSTNNIPWSISSQTRAMGYAGNLCQNFSSLVIFSILAITLSPKYRRISESKTAQTWFLVRK